MTLEEFLSKNEDLVSTTSFFSFYFSDYIKSTGIENIKKEHLDKLINRFGINVFQYNQFADLYKVIAADDTNRIMKKWTSIIGWLTFAIAVMTLIMLILAFQKP